MLFPHGRAASLAKSLQWPSLSDSKQDTIQMSFLACFASHGGQREDLRSSVVSCALYMHMLEFTGRRDVSAKICGCLPKSVLLRSMCHLRSIPARKSFVRCDSQRLFHAPRCANLPLHTPSERKTESFADNFSALASQACASLVIWISFRLAITSRDSSH